MVGVEIEQLEQVVKGSSVLREWRLRLSEIRVGGLLIVGLGVHQEGLACA